MAIVLEKPKSFSAVFMCPVCQTCYTTEGEARKCAETKFPDSVAVGTVTEFNRGYTWYHESGDLWIAGVKPGNPKARSHFDHQDTYIFYYVVTAVACEGDIDSGRPFRDNRRMHRTLVWITSGALGSELSSAWTTKEGHYGWGTPLEDQSKHQHLVELARPLFGKTPRQLL